MVMGKKKQKKQESVKTPKQRFTQIKTSAGQKFQERIPTPPQFKTQKYDDAKITERIKRATA
jgi:hypothetical protein